MFTLSFVRFLPSAVVLLNINLSNVFRQPSKVISKTKHRKTPVISYKLSFVFSFQLLKPVVECLVPWEEEVWTPMRSVSFVLALFPHLVNERGVVS